MSFLPTVHGYSHRIGLEDLWVRSTSGVQAEYSGVQAEYSGVQAEYKWSTSGVQAEYSGVQRSTSGVQVEYSEVQVEYKRSAHSRSLAFSPLS